MTTKATEREGKRLLTAIYVLAEGKTGACVPEAVVEDFIQEHALYDLTEEQFQRWNEQYVRPIVERCERA